MKKHLLSIAILFFFLLSCHNEKKVDTKADFEKSFQKNVSVCASTLIKNSQIDSISAVNYCSCALTKYYEIDSTYINLSGDKLEEFINKNAAVIANACDTFKIESIKN